MKLHRINGLLIRHLYLYRRSFPRLMDLFYWPVMDILLWGFLSIYLEKFNLGAISALTVLLGAIIFGTSSTSRKGRFDRIFEDVWERNLLNIFVTPLRLSEFLMSTFLLGFVRITIVSVIMAALSFVFYRFNIFQFGFAIIPFAANLLVFGWTLGIFTTGLILRHGTAAQILAFGFILLIQPFTAVFYPVSSLPSFLQPIAYLFPSTYVFEGMREVARTGTLSQFNIVWGLVSNLAWAIATLYYFNYCFANAKKRAALMRLD